MKLSILDHLYLLRNLTDFKLLLQAAERRDVGLTFHHLGATTAQLLKFGYVGNQRLTNLQVGETIPIVLIRFWQFAVHFVPGKVSFHRGAAVSKELLELFLRALAFLSVGQKVTLNYIRLAY